MSDSRNAGAWIYRGLVVVGAGLLLFSWFMPLWGLDIEMLRPDAVLVQHWGEELFIGAWADVFDIPKMPSFFPVLMWIYLAIAIALLLASLVLPERPFTLVGIRLSVPQAIIGFVGISYIVYVVVAAIVIAYNLGQFEVAEGGVTTPLQGDVTLDFGDLYVSKATSSLRLGYWLSLGAGIFLVALALLRPKIMHSDSV